MTVLSDKEKIKVFVKNTLGCRCPDKVFEKIEISKLLMAGHIRELTRIVVGDTLLIYITPPGLSDDFAGHVESIGLAGKNDRDSNSYNRFRLVVSDLGDGGQQGKVSEHFSRSFSTDEKMHLHFVNEEQLPG